MSVFDAFLEMPLYRFTDVLVVNLQVAAFNHLPGQFAEEIQFVRGAGKRSL